MIVYAVVYEWSEYNEVSIVGYFKTRELAQDFINKSEKMYEYHLYISELEVNEDEDTSIQIKKRD